MRKRKGSFANNDYTTCTESIRTLKIIFLKSFFKFSHRLMNLRSSFLSRSQHLNVWIQLKGCYGSTSDWNSSELVKCLFVIPIASFLQLKRILALLYLLHFLLFSETFERILGCLFLSANLIQRTFLYRGKKKTEQNVFLVFKVISFSLSVTIWQMKTSAAR